MKKITFLLAIVALISSCTTNYSEGERTGIITKFSKKGLVWKSYEGELKIAPNIGNGGMVGQYETYAFSIDNDNSIPFTTPLDSVNLFVKEGIPVNLIYQETAGYNWWGNRGETDRFVRTITRANK